MEADDKTNLLGGSPQRRFFVQIVLAFLALLLVAIVLAAVLFTAKL
jgi:hypothetical protein